jgi:hypothetical protein
MPKFFISFRNGNTIAKDELGIDLPSFGRCPADGAEFRSRTGRAMASGKLPALSAKTSDWSRPRESMTRTIR